MPSNPCGIIFLRHWHIRPPHKLYLYECTNGVYQALFPSLTPPPKSLGTRLGWILLWVAYCCQVNWGICKSVQGLVYLPHSLVEASSPFLLCGGKAKSLRQYDNQLLVLHCHLFRKLQQSQALKLRHPGEPAECVISAHRTSSQPWNTPQNASARGRNPPLVYRNVVCISTGSTFHPCHQCDIELYNM